MRAEAPLAIAGQVVVLRRAAIAEILPLRHRELRPGLPPPTAEFAGDRDVTTCHYGAFLADEPVACASLMAVVRDGEAAFQLRGMATRGDLVRRGLGRALLRHAVADRALSGVALFWCNARLAAVPFYRRMGWQVVSKPFDIPGIGPHHVMTFRTAAAVG